MSREPQLYVARVRPRHERLGTVPLTATFVVYSASTADALRAIRKERGPEWTIQFMAEDELPLVGLVDRTGLKDGRARALDR
jgi:hypothetical protein